ncbi:MAG TPA: alpha/beta hydrolase [Acidimicrobiia bacterium]|nr:alpha/beta hydrolase [Acidimicrobiia bacterium]
MSSLRASRTGVRVTRHARGRLPGDGVELAYGFWPGRGAPIVAIHALTASYMTFVGIGERLVGRRPLLAPDLRGRGDSDKPAGPYGMQQHAADVAAAMRAFGLGPSVVVGHSMGAYVATVLAVDHPDLVAGLVLLDGGHPPELPEGLDSDALLDRILGPVIDRLHRDFDSAEEYLDTWRQLPIFADVPGHSAWGPWVEAYLRYDLARGRGRGHFRPKALEAAVRADFADMGRRDEVERRLEAVRAPVMVVRAECGLAPDQPGVLEDSHLERIRTCIPDVVEHTLADTTHYTVALAEPGASTVAGLLVDFADTCGV